MKFLLLLSVVMLVGCDDLNPPPTTMKAVYGHGIPVDQRAAAQKWVIDVVAASAPSGKNADDAIKQATESAEQLFGCDHLGVRVDGWYFVPYEACSPGMKLMCDQWVAENAPTPRAEKQP